MSVSLAWMCTLTYLCMCVCSAVMHRHVHLLVTILVIVHLQSLVLLLVYNIDSICMRIMYISNCAHSILSYLTPGCPGSHFVMNHAFMLNWACAIMESFSNDIIPALYS